jgi:hypothetical protein
MRGARQVSLVGVALAVSFTATVAVAQVTSTLSTPRPRSHESKASNHRAAPAKPTKPLPHAPRGHSGPRGFAGIAGTAGEGGDTGPTGPPGPPGVVDQALAIDWQNGNYRGQDSATFVAPGIGVGVVDCGPDTQWVNFTPYDQGADSEMWAAIMRGNEVSVRAAARRSPFYGEQFNLGLNVVNGGEAEGQGSMVGIISSRGAFGAPGGEGPPPTTFHLSWHWSFADAYGPRCYVAGRFETER